MHDLDSIYKVPLFMEKQGALEFLQERLNFPMNIAYNRVFMKQWKKLSDKCVHVSRPTMNKAVTHFFNFSVEY